MRRPAEQHSREGEQGAGIHIGLRGRQLKGPLLERAAPAAAAHRGHLQGKMSGPWLSRQIQHTGASCGGCQGQGRGLAEVRCQAILPWGRRPGLAPRHRAPWATAQAN